MEIIFYQELNDHAEGFGEDLFQTGLYVTDKYIYYISVGCEFSTDQYLTTIDNKYGRVRFDIYKRNRKNGKEKKVGSVLVTKKAWYDWDSSFGEHNVHAIKKLTDKYCIYTPDGTKYYKYIYATKKNVRVKK